MTYCNTSNSNTIKNDNTNHVLIYFILIANDTIALDNLIYNTLTQQYTQWRQVKMLGYKTKTNCS